MEKNLLNTYYMGERLIDLDSSVWIRIFNEIEENPACYPDYFIKLAMEEKYSGRFDALLKQHTK